jgi:transcriptional regulator with XRE-family HTH domain
MSIILRRQIAELQKQLRDAEKQHRKDVGARLLELREGADLNQIDLADLIDIERTSISNLESGNQGFTLNTITAICAEFSVCADWLLFGEGEKFRKNLKLPKQTTESPYVSGAPYSDIE